MKDSYFVPHIDATAALAYFSKIKRGWTKLQFSVAFSRNLLRPAAFHVLQQNAAGRNFGSYCLPRQIIVVCTVYNGHASVLCLNWRVKPHSY